MSKATNDSAHQESVNPKLQAWEESLTARIIADLQEGVPTWEKCWRNASGRAVAHLPINGTTGRPYNGANVLYLWAVFMERGYKTQQWATLVQARAKGWHIRKGEKASPVIFVKHPQKVKDEAGDSPTVKDEKAKKRRGWSSLAYVFNFDQIDGIPAVEREMEPYGPPTEPYFTATRLVKDAGVKLQFGHDRAAYYPAGDTITMPDRHMFVDDDAFAGTLFHEGIHWTGHSDRLARDFGQRFRSQKRAAEEIVAEMGSAFLSAQHGISPRTKNKASYIKSWLTLLENDSRAIVSLASRSSQAAKFINDAAEAKRLMQAAE